MNAKIENDKDVKIIVATHKKYQMPKEKMYLPVHVGSKNKESIGYQRDDEGDNISEKNPYYCELTGLYWAWKNLKADYLGLSHYRRYFAENTKIPAKEENRFKNVLTYETANKLLEDVDIILPTRRKYYIENIYNHYKKTMYIEPLDETRKIIEEKYPEYVNEFDKIHTRTSAHLFNMFIMKKEKLDEYLNWLFDILFELEKRCDPTKYDSFHARYLGRVSERLLDVWINTRGYKYKEVKFMSIQKVDWFKKGSSFLISKFTGKKYGKSF